MSPDKQPPGTDPELWVGCISGTSIDGLDIALASFGEPGEARLLAGRTVPLPTSLRASLLSLCSPGEDEIRRMGAASVALGRFTGQEILSLLQDTGIHPSAVCAIGSHGQTIRHHPDDPLPFSLQIGDPNTIAEITGIDTASDFRGRDISSGGQGAPLVPAFHHFLVHQPGVDRVLVNIGGMANISLLHGDGTVSGFDTGPGNVLLDCWISEHSDQAMDIDGQLAAQGRCDAELLAVFLDDPYFRRKPPKSIGREHFNRQWLAAKLAAAGKTPDLPDMLATLTRLTAQTISEGCLLAGAKPAELFVCGGGRLNQTLMHELGELCSAPVNPIEALGLDGDLIEALAFAWLAMAHKKRRPGNVTEVTGARAPKVLGALYPGGLLASSD